MENGKKADRRSQETRTLLENEEENQLYSDTNHKSSDSDETRWRKCRNCSCILKRHILAVMTFLGFALIYGMRINLSVALVDMVTNKTYPLNHSGRQHESFNWDTIQQGVILGSFFMGYMVMQIPGGWFAAYIGGTRSFGVGIISTAAFTLLTPPATRAGFTFLIIIRILEGLCEGLSFPAIHAIWSVWAPSLEKSKLTSISISGAYFGTVIGLPIAGELTNTLGWDSVFYFYGVAGIVWYLLWLYLIYHNPNNHPTISKDELEYLRETACISAEAGKSNGVGSPPWRQIFSSVPFWAILVAHFCENWGFYTLLTTLPTYFNKVLRLDIEKTGFLSALPYLCMTITCQIGGQVADYWRSHEIFTTTTVRKFLNTMGFMGQGIFLVITANMTSKAGAIACIAIGVGFSGFGKSGYMVNHLDLSPKYASILLGITNFFASIPGIVSPIIVGILTTEERPEQWQIVFYVSSILYIVGAIFYLLFASGEKQPWSDAKKNSN